MPERMNLQMSPKGLAFPRPAPLVGNGGDRTVQQTPEPRHLAAFESVRTDASHSKTDAFWSLMREEAAAKSLEEPILGSYFHATVLNHRTFGAALSFRLASKLENPMLPTMLIRDVISEALDDDPLILRAAALDVFVRHEMAAAMALRVPLEVGTSWGPTWADA